MDNNRSTVYGDGYDLLERSPQMPADADFAVVLTDDCMEPYFKEGESVWIKARAELEEFEAGLFLYDGRVLCRQWCLDHKGTVHLLCANPLRERENVSAQRNKTLRVLGRVVTDKKLPRPVYT